jgi:hypothetical protein
VKEGDLIAATHGRSFWILDDLSAVRQLSPTITTKASHLFKPRDAYRANFGGGGGTGAAGDHPTGQNPPSGAIVYYWVKSPNQLVTMDFLDASGKLIRSFTSAQDPQAARDSLRQAARADSLKKAGAKADSSQRSEARGEETSEEGPRRPQAPTRVSNKAGLNTFAWNMRYPDAVTFQNLIMWAAGTQGPVAPPGTYSVRMKVNGVTQTESFRIVKDPRSRATQADLQDQFAFLMQVRDETSKANNAVRLVRNIRAQVADRLAKLPEPRREEFRTASNPLLTTLGDAEREIYQTQNRSGQDPLNYPIRLNNKIAALAGVAASTDARPTDQTREVFTTLSRQLDTQLQKIRSTLSRSLPALNRTLTSASLPPIVESTDEPQQESTGARARGDDAEEDDGAT